jgi:hypothetical protein
LWPDFSAETWVNAVASSVGSANLCPIRASSAAAAALAPAFLPRFFFAVAPSPSPDRGLVSADDDEVWMSGVSSFIARF